MAGKNELYLLESSQVEVLTAAIGAAAALLISFHWGVKVALSFSAGAGLSLLNYRWLKRGVASVGEAATAKDGVPRRRSKGDFVRFLGRYVFVIGVAYVILSGLKMSAIALVAGLLSVVPAIIAASVWNLIRSDSDS
jgi:hypothetical protein